ncbi:YciI family protein [Parvularcula flava]|uniref:YciI family protein n=1 Tax=Aquisalinus luteolus TaxID=1566827 RepID=A0A8J3A2B4_9PROT|nr:YciI family protein [Aquisalinus luteolus]NHK28201.1 YciI family protein [Aquisalinus luteolus]GGH97768.1 hypothetical protein GCM10011355_19780 [Aquisalinus luteolus]
MPHFILICRDGPDGPAKRPNVRPEHLDHVADHGSKVKIAGPLLDEEGNPSGSLFLLDMADRAEVEAFAAEDPYQKAGVFISREIRPFKIVVDNLSE